MSQSIYVTRALEKVREWGSAEQLQQRMCRLTRQKLLLTFVVPPVCLAALIVLSVVMKTQAVYLDPQLSGFAWFMLLALTGATHLLGLGHSGGYLYLPSPDWVNSNHWHAVMQSPGARTVYAAVLDKCGQPHLVHHGLIEGVYHAELAEGLFEDKLQWFPGARRGADQ